MSSDVLDEVRARPQRIPATRPAPSRRHVPALDGLRAIAVVAVITYHADLTWATGGFLGVEVFFTLSGFLVTGLLVAEIGRRGRVDVGAFYRARARRLVPALVVCVAGTLALYPLVLGDSAPDLRADALASLAYAQNWHLVLDHVPYAESFDRPSPLLHLWSLAVEGQLYLVWPVVLVVALGRFRPRTVAALALALAAASAGVMALVYDPDDVSRAYYGTDTRTAGFLVGAALALALVPRPGRRPAAPPVVGHAVDLLGGAALVALVVGLSVTSEYADPLYLHGGFARTGLLTALVIAAGLRRDGHVAALLSRAPLVWLGQRSYGIYLYHWPIFALTRPGIDVPDQPVVVNVARIAATLVVAEISYRVVELPVRRGILRRWGAALRRRVPRLPKIALVGVGVTLAVLTSSCGPLGSVPGPDPAARTATAAPDASSPPQTRATVESPSPSTTAAAPPAPDHPAGSAPLVVGDSVVLGSADTLRAALGPGTVVDGEVGRQFTRGPAIVAAWTAAHPGPVVVHLGSNGIIRDDDLEAIVRSAAGRRVVFVTVAVPRRWEQPDNTTLRQAAQRHPGQVVLADWNALVEADPGLLGPDHVHPSVRGRTALATVVGAALSSDR